MSRIDKITKVFTSTITKLEKEAKRLDIERARQLNIKVDAERAALEAAQEMDRAENIIKKLEGIFS